MCVAVAFCASLGPVACGGAVQPGDNAPVSDANAQNPNKSAIPGDANAAVNGYTPGKLQGGASLGPGATAPLVALVQEIGAASTASGVAADVLAAVIWAESRGDVDVAGGGLMQIGDNEFAQQKLAHPEIAGDSGDAGANVMAGAFYLVQLQGVMQDKFGRDDLGITLRAYNSGENGVDPNDLSALPAGTGSSVYVTNVTNFAAIVASGQGSLPP